MDAVGLREFDLTTSRTTTRQQATEDAEHCVPRVPGQPIGVITPIENRLRLCRLPTVALLAIAAIHCVPAPGRARSRPRPARHELHMQCGEEGLDVVRLTPPTRPSPAAAQRALGLTRPARTRCSMSTLPLGGVRNRRRWLAGSAAQGDDHDTALRDRRGQFLPAFLELGDAALLNLAGDVST